MMAGTPLPDRGSLPHQQKVEPMSKMPKVPPANRSPHGQDPRPDVSGKTPPKDHSTETGQDANTRINLDNQGHNQNPAKK